MGRLTFLFVGFVVAVGVLLGGVLGQHLACENRRPEGHQPERREGDGGFKIIVVGNHSSRDVYIPNEVYTVTIQGLKTRYSTQKFTEFLLVAESEKQAMMGPTGLVTTGIFHIMDDTHTRFSDVCPDGVTSFNRQPKSEISVMWTAPSVLVASCVTFKATVVERPHRWFMDDGLLTKTICPEMPGSKVQLPPPPQNSTGRQGRPQRQRHTQREQNQRRKEKIPAEQEVPPPPAPSVEIPTVTPPVAEGPCCACDDAKYDILFEGIWSKETHPKDFPENEWLLHFSDIIGASHAPNFTFWNEGEIASEGVRQVAEWGATRQLENELKRNSGSINTIIKARGLWHPNENGVTSAAFRVDRRHPKMSLVSMIGPSPDWLVGVFGIQLCLPNCTWVEEATLDLFPYDAGSDSGITYMSPNTPTEPRGRIRPLTESDPDDSRSPFHSAGKMKPFAKVSIRRQRIYAKSCDNETSVREHEIFLSENTDDDINRPECAVTEWTSWSGCSVTCGKGLRMRKRHYTLPTKADMFRCDRQLVEKEMCLGSTPTCPPDEEGMEEIDSVCAVTPWTEWSPCSVTCGEGTKTRHRRYKSHMGRKKCSLELLQSETCRGPVPTCDPLPPSYDNLESECPLSPWSEWSPCSVTCGQGVQLRTRVFIPPDENPLPQKCDRMRLSQRMECVGEYGSECKIPMNEAKEICMMEADTGPCRGHKLRFHFNPLKGMCVPFTYGGCKGNRNRFDTEEDCNDVCGFLTPLILQNIPDLPPPPRLPTMPTLEVIGRRRIPFETDDFVGTYSSTPRYFRESIFERATATPLRPVQTFPTVRTTEPTTDYTYTTTQEPTTEPIQASDSEELNLDLGAASLLKQKTPDTSPTTPSSLSTIDEYSSHHSSAALVGVDGDLIIEPEEPRPNSIDCVVSPWREWTPCSVTCGLGYRTRAREILIEPQNGGKRCPRKTKKKKSCQMAPCQ